MFRDYHMTAGRKVRGPWFGFSLYKSNIKKMYISRWRAEWTGFSRSVEQNFCIDGHRGCK
jgi:hypothetical protein